MTAPPRRPTPGSPAARRGRLTASVCLALWCAATPAWAQTAGGPSLASNAGSGATSIEALVLRLDQLEAEVRTLRAQLAATQLTVANAAAQPVPMAAAVTSPPPVDAPPSDAAAHGHDEGDASPADSRWRAPQTQIHWFSDIGFVVSDRTASTSSFGLGQLDLFLTSKLSDQWTVLSEIVFRANTDNRFVVTPERLLVQYEPTDRIQIAMGRYHSSVGYYNAVYHHGSWFETAASRPSMFSAGFIPYHNVGVSSRTRVPSGPAGLEAIAEFGNGLASTSRTLEPTQSVVDEDNHKAFNLGVVTKPTRLPGFQAGASWYRDRLHPTGVTPFAAHTSAAHVVYTGGGWELLNEVVVARHVPDGGPARASHAWYTQSSYGFGGVRPYLRYQSVDGDATDPIFGALGHRYGPVAGVRIDFSRFAAVKLQLGRSYDSKTDTTAHDGTVKLAFTF
jgi:hypothetical protein